VNIATGIDGSHAMGAFYLANPNPENLKFYKTSLILFEAEPPPPEAMVRPPGGDGGEIGD
jgi:hypothetical protein